VLLPFRADEVLLERRTVDPEQASRRGVDANDVVTRVDHHDSDGQLEQ
jgi:hypothetical protein